MTKDFKVTMGDWCARGKYTNDDGYVALFATVTSDNFEKKVEVEMRDKSDVDFFKVLIETEFGKYGKHIAKQIYYSISDNEEEGSLIEELL